MSLMATLNTRIPNKKNLSLLFFAALVVRAAVFFFYVQHEERYQQPDSNDYHIYAAKIVLNQPMPRYWRTPGYPLYLSIFYRFFGVHSGTFSASSATQKAAIWGQIILSSLIPLILFFLAYALTGSYLIAWILAWISVIHLGLVLASTYLLTEGIALIFFYLFLLFFYKSFRAYGEYSRENRPPLFAPTSHNALPKKDFKFEIFHQGKPYLSLAVAALSLGITTWMRPMGLFIAIIAAALLLLFAQDTIQIKLKKVAFFLVIFFASIAPWYMRNYQRTGKIFFCPMFGIYLNSFTAPRILRDIYGLPLEKTWGYLQHQLSLEIQKDIQRKGLTNITPATKNLPIPELLAGTISWPIVLAHPWLAAMEWSKEVCISTFDLYSYQLIALVKKSFKSDPLEAFLGERLAECLYRQPVPLFIRSLCWLEFIFSIFLWIGLLAGIWFFLLRTLIKKFQVPNELKAHGGLWLKTGFLIGATLFMTGGFGYARLRLPVEPLIIVLALTSWIYILKKKSHSQE